MGFNPFSNEYRSEMLMKWHSATLTGKNVDKDTDKILSFKDIYDAVELKTGVPWWLVGCFDMRECGFNHKSNLANGDPLDKPTVHVPAGVGPFSSWEDGAVFALKFQRLNALKLDLIGWLIEAERYNGEGYHKHSDPSGKWSTEPSPYLWSGTSIYTSGKYVADGQWDPKTVDAQTGVAVAKTLLNRGFQI